MKEENYKDMPGSRMTTQLDEDGQDIRPKFLSNHTHYSPTDPDVKISTKPGKPRQLNYADQLAVDDAHHGYYRGLCKHLRAYFYIYSLFENGKGYTGSKDSYIVLTCFKTP